MAASNISLDTESNTISIRDELVETAVKFLQNPRVINSPLAQKQKFLQRRGLTDKEIQVACEKSGAYSHFDQQNVTPPPLPNSNFITSYRNYGQVQLSIFDRIRDVVHNIAIFSIVAYIIHKFYQNYIAPFLFGRKKKSIEDSVESLEKNMKSSMGELKDSLTEVKVEVDRISCESDTHRQLSELKQEITTVKGLLLTRKQFPSVVNTPAVPQSIPAWQMSSVAPDNETDGDHDNDHDTGKDDLEVGSGSGSSEPEHGMKTSESSLEIIYSSRDCDTESCHSRKSKEENGDNDKE